MGYKFEKYSIGGGGGIIDVAELPTENIDEKSIYRVTFATVYYGSTKQKTKVYVVNGLPEIGEDLSTDLQTVTVTYYNIADGVEYGYISDAVASAAQMASGWYPMATLYPALGVQYGGVVSSISELTAKAMNLLLEYKLYYYKVGWHCMTREIVEVHYLSDSSQFESLADEVFEKIQKDYQNIDIHFYPSYDHSDSYYVMHLASNRGTSFWYSCVFIGGSANSNPIVSVHHLTINTTAKTIESASGSSTFSNT